MKFQIGSQKFLRYVVNVDQPAIVVLAATDIRTSNP
jgi:hypothetical protein